MLRPRAAAWDERFGVGCRGVVGHDDTLHDYGIVVGYNVALRGRLTKCECRQCHGEVKEVVRNLTSQTEVSRSDFRLRYRLERETHQTEIRSVKVSSGTGDDGGGCNG